MQSPDNPEPDSDAVPVSQLSLVKREQFPIAAVGASAGGLESFLQLMHAMSPGTGIAFVFIQHLERTHESQLSEILGRSTSMPVMQAEDGMTVEPNHVYVIPPNTALSISGGILRIAPRTEGSGAHLPINHFFSSLAKDVGPQSIGIVLSGTGSDGAQGLLAIKQECGITFAQDESTAKYSGMPHSAIATGAVDFVLSPQDLAKELSRIVRRPLIDVDKLQEGAAEWIPESETDLKSIFAMLHSACKVDFTHYKRTTVRRRIGRRMIVHNLDTLGEYVRFLERNSGEVAALFRDILINVTSFFREPESFQRLAEHIRTSVLDRLPDESVRVWVAGCATGEEVYSIAMCLEEILVTNNRRTGIQIFGTDISERALERARSGIYPESITVDVSADRLRRFFSRVDGGYQVTKSIRDCCIFARHDLTKDPPFARMDLVSCRNVLIYMGVVLQKRILPMFHYSLKPTGLLMLGSAEALAGNSDLFSVIDKETKIFSKLPAPGRFIPQLEQNRENPERQFLTTGAVDNSELEVLTNQAIHDRYAVDGVVVNREMRIMLFRGHTGSYLDPAPGNPSFNLLRMVREELAFKLESMVSRAIEQNIPIRASGIRIERSGDSREIEIEVVPLRSQRYSESYYFVLFTDVSQPVQRGLQSEESAAGHETDVDQRTVRLQRELARARGHLRRMAEEHEGNVEELRATNEEVRSTNEELQSTNEELATAKEELQSANEELTTINEELQTKNADLGSLNNDLKNLFVAVNLPIVIVDNEYRLRRFTPAAENFLNLLSSDIGRVVTNLRGTLEIPNLKELLRKAIEELNVSVFEIEAANNRWYSVTIRPYRTTDHRIDGAVIAFNDIDSLKRSLDEAQDARDYAEGIVETIWEPLIVLDKELRVQRAAPRFYQTFQVTPEDTEGRLLFDVGSRQWDIPQLRSQLEEVVARNSSFQNFEVQRMFPNIGYRSMRLNARRIRQKRANMETVLLAIEDVTERQEAAEIRYRRLFETAKDGILVLNADDGQILDVNPFFVDLCKCTRDELMGKQIWETGLFDLTPEMRDLLSESQQRETVRYDGIRLNARDGKRIETEMICNRYAVAGERIIQCNIRDITDRSRAEADLRRSNEDLQQFAYAASHDLQEPLRMVGSYAQLLEKKYESLVDQEGRDFLQYITTGVERMSHLIKDLLVYSQTSTRDTRPEAVNAETVLAWTVMNLQMAISDSNAIITNDPLPTVSIDQMHFIQVFQNLIGNSLKYRKPNVIPRIHISAEHQGTEWVFTFRDNGLGFDTRYSKHIFGVFKRLHGRQYPGTGIGLSICKKIIERHGGRMWVESSPGDGATFYFTVPEVK